MTKPGESVEGITVPEGDPDALLAAGKQLQGVATQLEGSAGQIAGMPSLMSSWAGPGSSVFASLTGQEAGSVRQAALSVMVASTSIQIAAAELEDAQRRALKAVTRAKRAREEINEAKEAIREAVEAQGIARDRMAMATLARQAAETRLLASAMTAVAGDGAAAAAITAADAEYRAAERDLEEAQRREQRARDRLKAAEEDMLAARKDGEDAVDDARSIGRGLQTTLALVPPGVFGMPGAPARAAIGDAAGIPRPQPQHVKEVPLTEREPPENWPGWAKSIFKIGRGEVAAVSGAAGLAKKAYDDPEKIPGGFKNLGEYAWNDPVGFAKTAAGYDDLANGRWEDWFGGAGIAALSGGAGTVPARASRFNRVVGSPKVVPLGRTPSPVNSTKFAGRRFDPKDPNFGVRPGDTPPKISQERREALAAKYPRGVRFTRAGYPVFTPYATERVTIPNLRGTDWDFDQADRMTPDVDKAGKTWHHVEDGKTLELVPTDLHQAVRHTGSANDTAAARAAGIAPGGVFTPGEFRGGVFGGAAGFGAGTAGSAAGSP